MFSFWLCKPEVLLGETFTILCFGFYVVYLNRILVVDEFHLIGDQFLSTVISIEILFMKILLIYLLELEFSKTIVSLRSNLNFVAPSLYTLCAMM